MYFHIGNTLPPFGSEDVVHLNGQTRGKNHMELFVRFQNICNNLMDACNQIRPGKIPKYLVDELLYNSFCWGNKFDPNLIYSAKVFGGKKGLVLKIKDSGEGFNWEETILNGLCKNGGSGGNELRDMVVRHLDKFSWNYEDKGTTFNLMLLD